MADWNLTCLTVGPLRMNAWLLTCAGEAALIDPGDEPERLRRTLDASDCRLRYLLATHGHFDHVSAAAALQCRFDLPLRCHPDDLFLIEEMAAHQQVFGFPPSPVPRASATSPTERACRSAPVNSWCPMCRVMRRAT